MLERHTDGRELLQTVDGLVLDLDGKGRLRARDTAGESVGGPTIFMIGETV